MSVGPLESVNSILSVSSDERKRPLVLGLVQASGNTTPAAYALRTLLETAGCSCELKTYAPHERLCATGFDAAVSYGQTPPGELDCQHVHVFASDFFAPDTYMRRASLPKERIDRDGLSSLYICSESQKPTNPNLGPSTSTIHLDLVASTFVMLTCYEEVISSGSLDRRGRRMADESFQLRLSIIDRPVVNEYAGYMASILNERTKTDNFGSNPWSGSEFALALTRDIDSTHRRYPISLRRLAAQGIKGQFRKAAQSLRDALDWGISRRKDPYDNIDEITQWEENLGIRSSIYLMSSNVVGDGNYELGQLFKSWRIRSLQERGWEIGFHPGYRTYCSEAAFREEHELFQESSSIMAEGGRQHGLRFSAPFTWRNWEDLGYRYDASIGYAEREGFKCGICVPFRPFDILENRQMDLWEIPLVLMDCTLDSYRGMSAEQSSLAIRGIADQVRSHHGVFSLLWHNNYFGTHNAGWVHQELARFVEESVSRGVKVAPMREVLTSWEEWLDAR